MTSTAFTPAQLNGTACIQCGSETAPMIPVMHGPQGQLFQCETHQNKQGDERS